MSPLMSGCSSRAFCREYSPIQSTQCGYSYTQVLWLCSQWLGTVHAHGTVATLRKAALMTGLFAALPTPRTSYNVSGTAAKHRCACMASPRCPRHACDDKVFTTSLLSASLPCIAGSASDHLTTMPPPPRLSTGKCVGNRQSLGNLGSLGPNACPQAVPVRLHPKECDTIIFDPLIAFQYYLSPAQVERADLLLFKKRSPAA